VTEVSRARLLASALRTGDRGVERQAVAACQSLVAISRPAYPPQLFHKPDLVAPGGVGLAPAVRQEIARATRQVVGVVINAVDDHLARGDQVRVRWTVDVIAPLDAVLEAAREGGRAVVLASDHGHVLERDLVHRPYDTGGLRYRADDGAPAADEVALRGRRVLSSSGGVIAPWTERLRYGPRQCGYHGGATPQEVVVPLAVLVPAGQAVAGWIELPLDTPAWWEGAGVAALEVRALPGPPSPREAPVTGPGWIDRLLASPVYATQKALAGRVALPDDRVHACLASLDERGGKLTRPALARALGVPLVRAAGIVAALRRVLNVEGYAVVAFDELSDTVVMNRALLDTQFGL
jgi:hypothetical protein